MKRYHGGVVTAIVKDRDTEQGRLRVEFPAMEDDLLSAWAPIAAPMSGPSRGALFMPEVGDECLVAFEHGNFDHPYVIGFLWNGKQKASETEPENRVILTPGGNTLRFEDKTDDTRIILRSKGEHELLLEDKPSGPMARLQSKGGRRLALDDTAGQEKAELVSTSHRIVLDDGPGATKIEINAGMGAVVITLNAMPTPSISVLAGGNSIDITPSAMSVTAAGTLSLTTIGTASITAAGSVSLTAGGAVSLTASAVAINSAIATFSGTVVASSIIAPLYSPGVGNIL
jgi:hypothetical protein